MSNASDQLLLGAEKGTIIHVQKLKWRMNVSFFFLISWDLPKLHLQKQKHNFRHLSCYGLIWIKALRYSMREVTEGHAGMWAAVC